MKQRKREQKPRGYSAADLAFNKLGFFEQEYVKTTYDMSNLIPFALKKEGNFTDVIIFDKNTASFQTNIEWIGPDLLEIIYKKIKELKLEGER